MKVAVMLNYMLYTWVAAVGRFLLESEEHGGFRLKECVDTYRKLSGTATKETIGLASFEFVLFRRYLYLIAMNSRILCSRSYFIIR